MNNSLEIISKPSLTTNCLVPMAKVIHDNFGITEELRTVIHTITATHTRDETVTMDMELPQNIIFPCTGFTKTVGKILTELSSKVTAMAFHSPTPDVSTDLTYHLEKTDKYDNVKKAVKQTLEGGLKNIYFR